MKKQLENQNEKWLSLAGTENKFFVSDSGRIKRNSRILKPANFPVTGYNTVCLCLHGVKYIHYLHELVANAFLGSAVGKAIAHLNCNQSDNRAENLSYMRNEEFSDYKRKCFPARKAIKEHEGKKMFELKSQGVKATGR